MSGEPQPQIIAKKSFDLGRDIAMLGDEVATTLAPVLHVGAMFGIEEDHGLRTHRAALGGAERQRIDTSLPGHLRGRDIHPRQRIAEARTVHMHRHPVLVCDIGKLLRLGDAIDRAVVARGNVHLSGTIECDMLPVVGPSSDRGMIFQEASLYPWLTLSENVQLTAGLAGRTMSRHEVDQSLAQFGLDGRGDHRPAHLSGGEQQRGGLAAVLAARPAVLLADEVTGELDRASSAQLLDVLAAARKVTA